MQGYWIGCSEGSQVVILHKAIFGTESGTMGTGIFSSKLHKAMYLDRPNCAKSKHKEALNYSARGTDEPCLSG